MPLPPNAAPVQLVIMYGSSNTNVTVNLSTFSVNVNAIPGVSFAALFTQNVMLKGYWNGLTFIPPGQITLITAS